MKLRAYVSSHFANIHYISLHISTQAYFSLKLFRYLYYIIMFNNVRMVAISMSGFKPSVKLSNDQLFIYTGK